MKDINSLLLEITQLTTNIKYNYPELYRLLDENPITLPTEEHPKINAGLLENYLESLKQLLRHHLNEEKTQRPG
ncbi:hypothetical protein [Algoriphagus sp. CAU 1675]|uniref:hypothetical protein n=1 Tax=Algoriphagus sp. CAU 1675 TaxID=3032597 RepID=UPI0023DA5004|nr:hypothetical protein [Algoriphagus sp. CAU 1675]MDF2158047.1 hypothetical protein [Algoriphagus sp. CAU 1675]